MDVFAEVKPDNFVYVSEIIPNIKQDLRYFGNNNFVGRPITGYKKPVCILTSAATHALLQVQTTLNKQNLGLLVYDCYRPQMAVNDFILWSQNIEVGQRKIFSIHTLTKEIFLNAIILRVVQITRAEVQWI